MNPQSGTCHLYGPPRPQETLSLSPSLLYVPRSSAAPFHPLGSCSTSPAGVISPPKGVPGGCGGRGPPVAAPTVVVVVGKGRGRGSAPPPARGGRAAGPRTGTLPEGGGTTRRQGRARTTPHPVGGGLLQRCRSSIRLSVPSPPSKLRGTHPARRRWRRGRGRRRRPRRRRGRGCRCGDTPARESDPAGEKTKNDVSHEKKNPKPKTPQHFVNGKHRNSPSPKQPKNRVPAPKRCRGGHSERRDTPSRLLLPSVCGGAGGGRGWGRWGRRGGRPKPGCRGGCEPGRGGRRGAELLTPPGRAPGPQNGAGAGAGESRGA